MQIMTFPLSKEVELGIRMTEIRRIESLKDSPDSRGDHLFFPQEWFSIPTPAGLDGLKGISLSSFREGTIAVPRIGRILRLVDGSANGLPHKEFPFLSRHRTIEGSDSWVLDVPLLRRHFSGETLVVNQDRLPVDDAVGLFQQVGQTARDIQRVLSLSASMVDSLRFMEGKIPETSHGLGVISQMTEEAAHKIMNILETIMEDHSRIRGLLRSAFEEKESMTQIEGILDQSDEKVMHGFEAMAFQDLVGQNIKLIGGHLKELESRLVRILIETSPDGNRKEEPTNDSISATPTPGQTLKGVGAQGDIDQNTVDQLLSEFGF